jgi:hypothetical protein
VSAEALAKVEHDRSGKQSYSRKIRAGQKKHEAKVPVWGPAHTALIITPTPNLNAFPPLWCLYLCGKFTVRRLIVIISGKPCSRKFFSVMLRIPGPRPWNGKLNNLKNYFNVIPWQNELQPLKIS